MHVQLLKKILNANIVCILKKITLKRILFIVGLALCCGWLILFAYPTSLLIYQYLNNESYYLDVVPLYLLPYAITPFIVNSFIEGLKIKSVSFKILIKQWVFFLVLIYFALLQLFACFIFLAAFFESFKTFELTLELLWLLLPINLFLVFLLLIRFLFQKKHILKLTSIS